MDEYYEKRFGHLRVLTYDEKVNMIKDLEEDIESLKVIINDKNTSSEQISELRGDIEYETAQLQYLNSILEEKRL